MVFQRGWGVWQKTGKRQQLNAIIKYQAVKEKLMEKREEKKKRTGKLVGLLKKRYPDARCALNFKDPLVLLKKEQCYIRIPQIEID